MLRDLSLGDLGDSIQCLESDLVGCVLHIPLPHKLALAPGLTGHLFLSVSPSEKGFHIVKWWRERWGLEEGGFI